MAMQLRSGRLLSAHRGDLHSVRPRRNQHGDNGKDHIGSLPKDMCLEVLARLPCTREAMRTSVLSEPWCHLWTELRELTFDNVADLNWLLRTLALVQPKLNRLCIQIASKLRGARISSLLHAADKLEPLELVVRLCEQRNARFVLPCFTRATLIELHISGLRFKLPPTGSFASLERLTISGNERFGGPGIIDLDLSALLPRCPCLRVLKIDGNCPQGVKVLIFESSSLNELVWHLHNIKQPVGIHVVAPNLEDFVFSSYSSKFTMSLSAPKLEKSYFKCFLEDYIVGCVENDRWRLGWLKLKLAMEMVLGIEMGSGSRWQHIMSLYIHNIEGLGYIPPMERSIEQELARLPVTLTHFSSLELHLQTREHVFGALVLQLLRIRTNIQRLKIIIMLGVDFDEQCWEHCSCDFASNWRNELIFLPHLEVAEFDGFRGHGHEMDFLKLLFGSAPILKRMTVRHFNTVSVVRGACQKLHNMFSANASVKFSFS